MVRGPGRAQRGTAQAKRRPSRSGRQRRADCGAPGECRPEDLGSWQRRGGWRTGRRNRRDLAGRLVRRHRVDDDRRASACGSLSRPRAHARSSGERSARHAQTRSRPLQCPH